MVLETLDKITLENKFAEDFASPFFPMLAEIYFIEKNFTRARKVCKTGLEHNSANTDGKFIFARIELEEENFIAAEKLLKQVIKENPAHFNGLRMLIDLEINLNRSSKTIQKYINKILNIIPDDPQCNRWLAQLNIVSVDSNKNINIDDNINNAQPIENLINSSEIDKNNIEPYDVDQSMATFTMVSVLKKQQHFEQALSILDVLESRGENKDKINKEKGKINNSLAKLK